MNLEHTQLISWGLSVPLGIFLFFFGAKCSAWCRRRKRAACWQWQKDVTTTLRLTGRGASRNFFCDLCIPEVLKVLITAGFALLVTLLSKPRIPCPDYFLSSGAAYLGRKNRITSVCPLANEKSIDKYALRTILYCPAAGRDRIGEKVPMELKIWIRDERVT